ncbi:MAG TPA: substrate-binding domain-containing protein [Solirubrobacteraceae bacterium]|jgi:tungstate transport system substrate-binding protein|nr:substrate-binding domain-containing protein [Solirubrobacteraceae bacterium]
MRHLLLVVLASVMVACAGDDSSGDRPVILATTTSTQDSGLLDDLIPRFERESGRTVQTVAVGSGQALEMGSHGAADVLLVHSPEAEQELVDSGAVSRRRQVMHNDFVLVGPPSDPAGVRRVEIGAALEKIAASEAPFISRGDESGTHALELKLWEQAGIEPAGDWYQESGQGMGATLTIAADKDAYAIADRGTYLSNEQSSALDVLVEGDDALLNRYHVLEVDPSTGGRVNDEGGTAFADWIVSDEVQQTIGEFGKAEYGRALFVPDA